MGNFARKVSLFTPSFQVCVFMMTKFQSPTDGDDVYGDNPGRRKVATEEVDIRLPVRFRQSPAGVTLLFNRFMMDMYTVYNLETREIGFGTLRLPGP
jgi:hypothetical protein